MHDLTRLTHDLVSERAQIGHLVAWYKMRDTGQQMAHWDTIKDILQLFMQMADWIMRHCATQIHP